MAVHPSTGTIKELTKLNNSDLVACSNVSHIVGMTPFKIFMARSYPSLPIYGVAPGPVKAADIGP